ncbi:MAG: signal peptide peptidase SppA [Myxococcales bacterium]|nr:signal peptide peptidase SppA [Myxococcales bacterium]
MLRIAALLLASGTLLSTVVASAQRADAPLHRATDPVWVPASSTLELDDAIALDVNPAGLGMLPAYSLAYVHASVDAPGEDDWLNSGDAVYLAGPIVGPLAAGFTLQSIRPGLRSAGAQLGGPGDSDRAMAALGLSLSASPRFSLGVSFRGISSGHPAFDGLSSVDIGILMRPSRLLSLSLVGRDLFTSREGQGTSGLDLGSSILGSIGLRPFASDALGLDFGLAAHALDADAISGRAGLSLALPSVGRLSSLLEVDGLGDSDQALRLITELVVQLGHLGVGGGAVVARPASDAALGWYGVMRVEGRPRSGLDLDRRVLDLRFGGLSPRGALSLSLWLERARVDERVAGVLLRPSGGMGYAYAQELRMQIRELRAAGKPVVCHLDSASGGAYYACAGADRILIDPAGDVRLMGTGMSAMFFGDALKRFGVRADFLRIGPQKGAPEQYTQGGMGEAARAQTLALLDSVHQRVLQDLSGDLKRTPAQVAELMDEGPYLAPLALERSLVHAAADGDALENGDLEIFKGASLSKSLPAPEEHSWGKQPSVGVIVVDDSIVDGKSVDIPLLDIHMTGGDTIVEALASMAADPSIRAIVLRVDSPGGAVLASDRIWRAVRRARERKPVIASMGAVAASGGYYVACAADEIWADPSTVTGSIGIFYGKVDVQELAARFGVNVEHFQRGRRAGAQSMWRAFTDEERAALAETLRVYYRLFLRRVAEGRDMKVSEVDAVARGRVMSGDAAVGHGLVDHLGGFASALIRARQRAGLPKDAPIVILPERGGGLLDLVLGGAQLGAGSDPHTPPLPDDGPGPRLSPELRSVLSAAVKLQLLGGGEAMALLPYELDF